MDGGWGYGWADFLQGKGGSVHSIRGPLGGKGSETGEGLKINRSTHNRGLNCPSFITTTSGFGYVAIWVVHNW